MALFRATFVSKNLCKSVLGAPFFVGDGICDKKKMNF